jgi:DNA polymerase elongation subunit (family B)
MGGETEKNAPNATKDTPTILLPLEAFERIEALKQYYGITQDGELVVKGIEARRPDIPNFIKKISN